MEDAPCVIGQKDPDSRKKGKHARQVSDLNNTAFSKRPKIMQSAIDQSLQSNTQSTKQLLANSLCEYFGSKRAKFRSSYQQEAIECVIDQYPSVLYVNGTNSEKSLTFFLPAFIEKRKYHVVLAPLVSLKGDLLERAKGARLNAAIWESSQDKVEKLMFVSFESIHQNFHWQQWIEAHRQEISRIYIDEAHTIIS